ncbi:alanine dehydrogenase [Halosquirtibacter laminarini]|uniref:Alanine dehydrogenase n=1 Tax=Halosquirtibacter laminarini TaxID=3374600 RepID=A0AC61NFA0_9BACT|nr:alanine dehydrogenase [Prolixibacteraceae bacterium]
MNNRDLLRLESLTQQKLLPQEELKHHISGKQQLTIGIIGSDPKEENRISLTPQGCELLIKNGNVVRMLTKAGKGASFDDVDYSEYGVDICSSLDEVFECQILVKMTPLDISEVQYLKKGQIIFSPLQLFLQSKDLIQKLQKKRVTCISFEYLQNDYNEYPIAQILSELSGMLAIQVATNYLSNDCKGRGVFLGGITGISPAEVVILGASTASEYAARSASAMGATVKVFDDSVNRLRDMNTKIGGYLSTSIFYPQALAKAFKSADVVIGALPKNSPLDLFIPEETMRILKQGAVVIDLNMMQGGCFEGSELRSMHNPSYVKNGLVYYCVRDITTRVSRSASIALSNVLTSVLLGLSNSPSIANHIRYNIGFAEGVYIYNGVLTNQDVGQHLGLDYKGLDLLFPLL